MLLRNEAQGADLHHCILQQGSANLCLFRLPSILTTAPQPWVNQGDRHSTEFWARLCRTKCPQTRPSAVQLCAGSRHTGPVLVSQRIRGIAWKCSLQKSRWGLFPGAGTAPQPF